MAVVKLTLSRPLYRPKSKLKARNNQLPRRLEPVPAKTIDSELPQARERRLLCNNKLPEQNYSSLTLGDPTPHRRLREMPQTLCRSELI